MNDKDLDAVAGAIGGFMATVLVTVMLVALTAAATMLCWNRAVPDVFGLPEITYTQAMWLSALVACQAIHWRH